jgi:hypothetical protein
MQRPKNQESFPWWMRFLWLSMIELACIIGSLLATLPECISNLLNAMMKILWITFWIVVACTAQRRNNTQKAYPNLVLTIEERFPWSKTKLQMFFLVHNTHIEHRTKLHNIRVLSSCIYGATSWCLANSSTTSAWTQMSYSHWMQA